MTKYGTQPVASILYYCGSFEHGPRQGGVPCPYFSSPALYPSVSGSNRSGKRPHPNKGEMCEDDHEFGRTMI